MNIELTPEQTAAVYSDSPDIILEACPGSGKTATLIERIADLEPLDHRRVIAITFTNKAAAQLREKLEARSIHVHFVGTLHALCTRMVRRKVPAMVVLDEEQSEAMLKQCITATRSKASLKACKAVLLGAPADVKTQPPVAAYLKALSSAGAVDFDTLLTLGAKYAPDYGTGWHLCVDEYQDSGPLDDAVYDGLQCDCRFFVGDTDQAIYSFRGATLENMRNRIGVRLALTGNFRSRPEIVEAATNVICRNPDRKKAEMKAVFKGTGRVGRHLFDTDVLETAAIIEAIRGGGEWAVLTRYNANRKKLDDALRAAGLPMPAKPAPVDGTMGMARIFLNLMANPQSPVMQAAWWRATRPAHVAQRLIETGAEFTLILDPPASQVELAAMMRREMITQGTVLKVLSAARAAGSLDPLEILQCLRDEEQVEKVKGAVTVATMHGAKGLEFDNVWIAGAEGRPNPERIQEERRLFFVAITRARTRLEVSTCRNRPNEYSCRMEAREVSPFFLEMEPIF